MQFYTADFAPGAATWRNVQNILIVSYSGVFGPFYGHMTLSTDQKYITCCVAIEKLSNGHRQRL